MQFLAVFTTLLATASMAVAMPNVQMACRAGGDPCTNGAVDASSCCSSLVCGADNICHSQNEGADSS